MSVQRLDHIGLVVDNIDDVAAFFVALGLEAGPRFTRQADWGDRLVGLEHVVTESSMVTTPDGRTALEITHYLSPADGKDRDVGPANRRGLRHLAFEVTDFDHALSVVSEHGLGMVGTVETFDGVHRIVYVRGPEGIIVELLEAQSQKHLAAAPTPAHFES